MTQSATLPILLRQLRLPAMYDHWQTYLNRAKQERWTPDQYLSALCELELTERYSRRIERMTRESRLPVGKTLSSFDFTLTPDLPPEKIEGLTNHTDWVKRAENLLFFGASGVGKTHLAAAVGHGLIRQGIRARYFTSTAIMQELQRARQDVQIDTLLNKLDKYSVIIIDDIGYVKKSEFETHALFELIAHRYETGSMIITSNQPFGQWDRIFADPVMTVAAIDRLVHHSVIIEINEDSYRRKQAMARQMHLQQNATTITDPLATITPGGAPTVGQPASIMMPEGVAEGGQAATITPGGAPAVGQPASIMPEGVAGGGQAATITPGGAPTVGQPASIMPEGVAGGGQAATITPRGVVKGGQTASIKLHEQHHATDDNPIEKKGGK